jgi:hypothetical protein
VRLLFIISSKKTLERKDFGAPISKLEAILCAFLPENSFVNLHILFVRARIKAVVKGRINGVQV